MCMIKRNPFLRNGNTVYYSTPSHLTLLDVCMYFTPFQFGETRWLLLPDVHREWIPLASIRRGIATECVRIQPTRHPKQHDLSSLSLSLSAFTRPR